jgi:hypothetical protein
VAPGAGPFSAQQTRALGDWALAQPALRAAVGTGRVRPVSAGHAVRKEAERPAVVLYLRNYDSGRVHQVSIDPTTGALTVRDLTGRVQPSREEIAEARAIVERDPALHPLVADPGLSLQGGFLARSSDPAHACARDVCVEFVFSRPGFPKGPARRVIVNLSRGELAERDWRGGRRTEGNAP